MSFPYVTGIPNPPDDPSTNVGDMQQNTDTINDWTQVDHVGFNNAAGGQHLQVRFSSNNVPAVPTVIPQLFTNLVGGLPQLFFYSGLAANTTDVYYINQNNSQAFPESSTLMLGGLIIKTGRFTIAGTGPTAITFFKPFPTQIMSVILTRTDNTANAEASVVFAPFPTGFSARNNFANANPYYYIAIGN